jgi:N-glycosidase YbiA
MTAPIKFRSTKGPYGALGNFSKHPIIYDGKFFATSEHLYQWLKLGDGTPETPQQYKIRMESNPKLAKDIANFNPNEFRPNWHEIKVGFMKKVLLLKCDQHPAIAGMLRSTGDAEIIEVSVHDKVWGQTPEGVGQNLLGKLWMQIREEIKNG